MGVNAIACGGQRVGDGTYNAGSWPAYLASVRRAPSAGETAPVDPAPWWTAEVGRAIAGAPALGDTLLAVTLVGGDVAVLHRETGRVLWQRRLDGTGAGGPLLAGNRLYLVTGGGEGRAYALNVRDGRVVWDRELGPLVGSPALDGTRLIVVTAGGGILALRTADGETVWRRRVRGPVRAGATVVGERVIVATDDSVHAFASGDGAPRAGVRAPGASVRPPAVAGDTLLVASPDGAITALDVETLEVLWRVPLGAPVFGTPAVARDTVFVTTLDGLLWAIPLGTPQETRTIVLDATIRAGPAPVRNGVLVGTVSGEVLLVQQGGIVEPRLRVDGPLDEPPLMHRGALFVVDGRGRVRTWR